MKFEEIKLGKKVGPSVVPIAIASILFPVSIIFWVINYLFSTPPGEWAMGDDQFHMSSDHEDAAPSRWLMSIAVPIIFTVYGIRKKSLNGSGALLALFVGFFLTLSSYCFLMCLIVFFLSSSRATKFRANKKRKFEEDFKEGGQRNWIQVICNGGMATELAILYLLDVGFGERPINFVADYRASWLGVGILGALSCANGDTWASEIGSVIETTTPRLITTWRKVPTGTNGGVTLGGLIYSGLGGLAVGFGYYLIELFVVDSSLLTKAPPQWPLLIVGTVGGLLGSVIDSLLGATLQYSGTDAKGKVHEIPGPNIKHISGLCLLDNHSINLLSTILTGLILPTIALRIWASV